MIDTNVMAGMQAHILHGMSKEDSHYVTDEETSQFWDALSEEINADNAPPGAVYEIVRE